MDSSLLTCGFEEKASAGRRKVLIKRYKNGRVGFLNKLDRKVTIQISRHRDKEPYQQVTLAP